MSIRDLRLSQYAYVDSDAVVRPFICFFAACWITFTPIGDGASGVVS